MINIQILHNSVYIKYEHFKKLKKKIKCCKWIQASQYAMYSIKNEYWDFLMVLNKLFLR